MPPKEYNVTLTTEMQEALKRGESIKVTFKDEDDVPRMSIIISPKNNGRI